MTGVVAPNSRLLKNSELQGMSFHRKSNEEIAIGFRPDQLMSYALNADSLHRYGSEHKILNLLNKAAALQQIKDVEVTSLSSERQRIVQEVSRLSRLGSFRQQVLFAYGQKCAITRVQLRLVDAAHILPVGDEIFGRLRDRGTSFLTTYRDSK